LPFDVRCSVGSSSMINVMACSQLAFALLG
jgi:hypothetical protein